MQEISLNRCDKCGSEAKVHLPYGPHRLCAQHFNEFFEHRVRKTMRTNRMVKYGEKVAVGVSGGKDSMVTLHMLNKVFGETWQNRIEAIMIDEGIRGYRDKAIEIAEEYCTAHSIPYNVVSMEDELGISTEQAMRRIHEAQGSMGATCSYCGVFRRQMLNRTARETGAQKLATGHNMDDEVQSIAMNVFSGDFTRLARIGEVAGGVKSAKLVPRIKPLYETPEKDIIAYAALNGIRHYSDECCPYSWMAKRNMYRKTLNDLENAVPGTKHSILASFRKLKPALRMLESNRSSAITECAQCGEASNSGTCASCRQMEKLMEMRGNKAPIRPKILKKDGALTCSQTKSVG
ncbi:MAG: TIGR00269 family protein [Candidatus Diapherotrites archaeon]|uniref:TIGR00269 family protein n=1 Tax=Candidatus Iainarchaeum sp. TaxID=3101447 RepID=A0A8T3YKC8_9ARCH|nr:TIGR00269 family protein [Candidatus Diapherotrites archaeon]